MWTSQNSATGGNFQRPPAMNLPVWIDDSADCWEFLAAPGVRTYVFPRICGGSAAVCAYSFSVRRHEIERYWRGPRFEFRQSGYVCLYERACVCVCVDECVFWCVFVYAYLSLTHTYCVCVCACVYMCVCMPAAQGSFETLVPHKRNLDNLTIRA